MVLHTISLSDCIYFQSLKVLIKVALPNKKLSCNERELNANGTVDNFVSYQFLYTLQIKFPKTYCNIFNNCSLQHACLECLTYCPG